MAWYKIGVKNAGATSTVGDIQNDMLEDYSGVMVASAHIEGNGTEALGMGSHAEGFLSKSSGSYSHAEGAGCIASGAYSHAEGSGCTASGQSSSAYGRGCTASGKASHAHGYECTASGNYSHAHGYQCTASSEGSFAQGYKSVCQSRYSHSEGYCIVVSGTPDYTFACGSYNMPKSGRFFIVGKGTQENSRSNAFSISTGGTVYSNVTSSSGYADYAEMFEWADGNPDNEDRVGHFVTLCDGEKIRYAEKGEKPIGVVSATPAVLGDEPDEWNGKYVKDKYGRIVKISCEEIVPHTYAGITPMDVDDIEIPEVETHIVERPIISQEYDENLTYVPRDARPEWDAIGLMGKLRVYDDGTCEVGGKCTVGDGGIATAGDDFYVIERNKENIITVLGKFL